MKQAKIRSLIFITLVLLSGCKSSTSAPAPGLNASLLTEDVPKSIAEVTPARTLQLKLPALISSDQIPANAVSEFIVQGKAGQFLNVTVDNKDEKRNLPASSLFAKTKDGKKLDSLVEDFCTEEQMYVLPEDGAFSVLFDPLGHKATLHFSLVDENDPLVTVGLKPEQIAINFGGFGQENPIKIVSYDHTCEIGESWPASLSVQSKISFRIAQTKGYEEAFPKDKSMQLLQSQLHLPGKPIDAKNLPYANWGNDDATVMTARPTLITGKDWKAWRWIEGSSQDGDYPAGLSYVVEGITDDGRFFFRMTGAISHPAQRRLSTDNIVGVDEPARDRADTHNRLLLEKALASADPSSFTPNLNDLDAVIRSLKLKP